MCTAPVSCPSHSAWNCQPANWQFAHDSQHLLLVQNAEGRGGRVMLCPAQDLDVWRLCICSRAEETGTLQWARSAAYRYTYWWASCHHIMLDVRLVGPQGTGEVSGSAGCAWQSAAAAVPPPPPPSSSKVLDSYIVAVRYTLQWEESINILWYWVLCNSWIAHWHAECKDWWGQHELTPGRKDCHSILLLVPPGSTCIHETCKGLRAGNKFAQSKCHDNNEVIVTSQTHTHTHTHTHTYTLPIDRTLENPLHPEVQSAQIILHLLPIQTEE